MKGAIRWAGVGFAVLLVAMLAMGGASLVGANAFAGDKDSPGKAIVGNWEGTFQMPPGPVSVKMELRAEGDKIVGELMSPHGPWSITDVKLVDGKLNIEINAGERGKGFMQGVLTGDHLEGKYGFPPMAAGEFKMK